MRKVIESAGAVGAEILVVPLVDNSSIGSAEDGNRLLDGMRGLVPALREHGVRIAYETDFPPERVLSLLEGLPTELFGINYDIGNSASLGYDPSKELRAYGHRVIHVHVKDRVRGGTTVPLGTGNADFQSVFDELRRVNYGGFFVLQTARAVDDDHETVLGRYRDFVREEVSRRWT
jgi:Sugar phosphate isomerases/epimerases